ncbi:MAG: sulfotransferase family 2 domain-containing protein [Anaerolineales bacterium]|nr:sulfotransferase family 2 domain-containing protein [Anaerolineales bacterium]
MILSHKYKFIFIKTSKTAGTSIEIALSKFCDDADIITPISPADEKLRKRLGYRGPQNYTFPIPEALLPLPAASRPCTKFNNHSSAQQIRRCVGDIIWNSYYKFAFERNPWDRFLSFYYWRCRRNPRLTISELIANNGLKRLKKFGSQLYTISGSIALNKICLYEDLTNELEDIRRFLGLPEVIDLPFAKSTYRKEKQHYHDVLTAEQIQQIGLFFQDEIEQFGYEI